MPKPKDLVNYRDQDGVVHFKQRHAGNVTYCEGFTNRWLNDAQENRELTETDEQLTCLICLTEVT